MVHQEIFQDGIRYTLVKEAARGVDLVPDYISRMCREGDVRGIRHRGLWYVDTVSLGAFLEKKALEFDEYKKRQSQEAKEYRESFPDTPQDEVIPPVARATLPRFANRVTGTPVNAYRVRRSFRFTPLVLLLVVGSGIGFELFSVQGRSHKVFVKDSISLARANAAAVASLPIVDTVADGFYKLLCPYIALNGCTTPAFVFTTPQKSPINLPAAKPYAPPNPQPTVPIANLEPRTLPQQDLPAPVAETVVTSPSVERVIEKTRIIETAGVNDAYVDTQISALRELLNQRFIAMENANATSFLSISNSGGNGSSSSNTSSLNVTSSGATSTLANGIALSDGCFSVSGNCLTNSPWATNGTSIYYNTGNVGVGTTSPFAKLAVWGSGTNEGTLLELVNNASTTIAKFLDSGTGYFLGSIGIGTTTPFRKLSVTEAVSTAQQTLAFDATRYTDFLTDASGDFTINPSGNDALLTDDNLWVCTGGSCPSGAPAGTGNLIVESRLGVGTTTPDAKLSVETQDNTTNFLQYRTAGVT